MNYQQLEVLRDGFVSELRSAGAELVALGLHHEASQVSDTAKSLETGVFKSLVAGEFNRGKSTLINALLGRDLLATRILPCTALITVLRYSKNERVVVQFKDRRPERTMTFDEFREEYSLSDEDQEGLESGQATTLLNSLGDMNDTEARRRAGELQARLARFEEVDVAEFYVDYPLLAKGINLVDSPGLAESLMRTMQTEDQARKANAFIFLLSALSAPFTQTEKSFLLRLKERGLHRHLFVAVNFAGHLTPKKRAEVWEGLRKGLGPLFAGDGGEDLFERRVFMVDLKPLVEAWEEGKPGVADERTGLPALERALEDYLCGPEPLDAAFRAPSRLVDDCTATAEISVRQRLQVLAQPIGQTEAEIDEAKKAADRLLEQLERLEEQFRMAGESIGNFLYHDLVDFVQNLRTKWGGDTGYSNAQLNLKELGLWSITKTLWSKEEKKLLHSVLERESRLYIERSMTDWVEALPKNAEFSSEMVRIEKLLSGGAKDLLAQLERIKSSVGNVQASQTESDLEERKTERVLQALTGLIVGPSLMAAGLTGDGKWSGFLSKVVQRLVVGAVIMYFTPAGWVLGVVLALEAVFLGAFSMGLKGRFAEKLGTEINKKFSDGIQENRTNLVGVMQGYFHGMSEEFCKDIRTQLSQQQAIWDQLIKQKETLAGNYEEVEMELTGRLASLRHSAVVCRERLNNAGRGVAA